MARGTPQGFEHHPEAACLDSPLRPKLALVEDINVSAKLIRKLLPVTELASLCAGSPWWTYQAQARLGNLLLGAGIMPPAMAKVAERKGLTIILGYGGSMQLQQGEQDWSCQEGGCLMLSGEAFSVDCTLLSALAFELVPERILETAMVMGGLSQRPAAWSESFQQSQGWQLTANQQESALQTLLRQVIAMVVPLSDYSQALIDQMQLDDQVYRLVAAMLLPELQRDNPLDQLTQRGQQGRDSFDELIDFIKENLSQPLSLTLLESQSHYSRRALQYSFRERLGCTATQWIRNQRLDLARQQLQNPSPGDSVASIAALSGYRSLSLFSVDFQQRFHIKPSQLLREARSSLPPETW